MRQNYGRYILDLLKLNRSTILGFGRKLTRIAQNEFAASGAFLVKDAINIE